ncbi:MAG: hypothetical protein GC172_12470 [Phycisphaera sp.]|nr:hypothetical protein [Phycisphaera sp.]
MRGKPRQGARRKPRTTAAVAATLALGALAAAWAAASPGCASSTTRTARFVPPRADAASSDAPTGIGFTSVRWFVGAAPEARAAALDRIVDEGIAEAVESDLADNGFLLLRVDRARLGEVRAALGDSPYARSTLLGQPLEWTDLATAPVRAGTVLFVAGRPRESAECILRLAFRGWCFPTVEAAAARVEFRLGEDESKVAAVTIDPSLARPRRADLPDGRAVIELGSDEVLVVAARPAAPPPAEEKGPETPLPPTVAALLLDRSPFPDRVTVLVVVPSVADILPEPRAASR